MNDLTKLAEIDVRTELEEKRKLLVEKRVRELQREREEESIRAMEEERIRVTETRMMRVESPIKFECAKCHGPLDHLKLIVLPDNKPTRVGVTGICPRCVVDYKHPGNANFAKVRTEIMFPGVAVDRSRLSLESNIRPLGSQSGL